MDNSNKARLAPLTAAELAALPAIGGAAQDDGVLVSPVPADAPPMPSAHSKWGKPSARWPYRDADGALLFEVWRFDPAGERKQFLPLSLWHDVYGAVAQEGCSRAKAALWVRPARQAP